MQEESKIEKPESGILVVETEEDRKNKAEILEIIRAWKKRRERKQARSRFGVPQTVGCFRCKKTNVTLYNVPESENKVCASCRSGG